MDISFWIFHLHSASLPRQHRILGHIHLTFSSYTESLCLQYSNPTSPLCIRRNTLSSQSSSHSMTHLSLPCRKSIRRYLADDEGPVLYPYTCENPHTSHIHLVTVAAARFRIGTKLAEFDKKFRAGER